MKQLWILTAIIIGCLTFKGFCLETVVDTDIGRIEGFVDEVLISGQPQTLLKFYGIPYAEPPVGSNRFTKPIPKAPFGTTYQAKTVSPRCYEVAYDMDEFNSKNYTEDCLYLDIVIPGTVTAMSSLPVMVWIHGGGMVFESTSDYNTEVLGRFGDVVVVSINYRLGAFGFLRSADGALIGNQGLWDQHMALQWVNKHIKYFNGNPNDVTLFGQATGADCVLYQSVYSKNKGLFKRGISTTGSFFYSSEQPNAFELIAAAGCNKTTDMTLQIECLRAKPASDLANISSQYNFNAIVDGDFLVEHPLSIVHGNNPVSSSAREHFSSIDLMIGINNINGVDSLYYWGIDIFKNNFESVDDFNATMNDIIDKMIPQVIYEVFPHISDASTGKILANIIAHEYSDWKREKDPNFARQSVVDIASHYNYYAPALHVANAHSNLNKGQTYFYFFAMNPSNHEMEMPDWLKGSADGDELPFIFGEPISEQDTIWSEGFNFTRDEELASSAMMSMWTNFAKTGNPNTPNDITKYANVVWPEYTMTTQYYLRMATPFSSTSVNQRLEARKMDLWLNLLPNIVKLSEPQTQIHFNPSTGIIG